MSSEEPSVVSDVKVAAVLSVDVDVAWVVDYSLQSVLEWPVVGDLLSKVLVRAPFLAMIRRGNPSSRLDV